MGGSGRSEEEIYERRRLRRVILELSKGWEQEASRLKRKLEKEGIVCFEAEIRRGTERMPLPETGTAVLTDSPLRGKALAAAHVPYFGCWDPGRPGEMPWFPEAALVLERPLEADRQLLEEWMLRSLGLPARIARTKRLILREMTLEDAPGLEEISLRNDPRMTLSGGKISEEGLRSYIRYAYALQGYGLWAVVYQERLIGCCGFAPYEETEEGDDTLYRYRLSFGKETDPKAPVLELEYMLDPPFQRQGLGTEMCRAALAYAKERLHAAKAVLRTRAGNRASIALAEKLGFHRFLTETEKVHKN